MRVFPVSFLVILSFYAMLSAQPEATDPAVLNDSTYSGPPEVMEVGYNFKLLPVTIISAAVAVDIWMDRRELGNQIRDLESAGLSAKRQKWQKRQKLIPLGLAILAGSVSTFYMFQKVEIRAAHNRLVVSYKF